MSINEGQKVFNEILSMLEGTDLDYSLLQLKNVQNGYMIEIKAFLGLARKQQMGRVAEKYNLRLIERTEGLTLVKNS